MALRSYKRKRSFIERYRVSKRPRALRSKTKSYRRPTRTKFARRIMNVVNRNAETKEQMLEIADNKTIEHNIVTLLNNNAFYTQIGAVGEVQKTVNGNRIGKKIYAKGLSCGLIIESQQYRPNCDYWLYLVRNKRTPDVDIDNKNMMFEGLTDQIPTDYIDTDKCQILFAKKFKPRMPNPGIDDGMNSTGAGGLSDGNAHNATGGRSIPNPKLLTKFYVPLNRSLIYRDFADGADGSKIPLEASRYQWVMVAYNNNSTIDSGGTWPCGHLWLTTKMKFTDV